MRGISRKWFFVLALSLSPALLWGCDDDSGGANKAKECDARNFEIACENGKVTSCEDDVVKYTACGEKEVCDAGFCIKICDPKCGDEERCIGGVCVSNKECDSATFTNACNELQLLECKDDKYAISDCPNDGVCKGGACVAKECNNDDAATCEGKMVVVTCNNFSKVRTPCNSGQICENGECVKDPNVCEPACEGETECINGECKPIVACDPACEGDEICVDGSCVEPNVCEPACSDEQECVNGECKDKADECDPACKTGYSCVNGECQLDGECDPELFTKICKEDENKVVFCEDFKITELDCETLICKSGACTEPKGILPQNMGATCTCTDKGCDQMGVPKPAGGTINGCSNVKPDDAPGSALVCLRTYEGPLGPNTYFNNGYCSLSAVKCTKIDSWAPCGDATYGNYDEMQICPAGNVMVLGKFEVIILGKMEIENKTCAPKCDSDDDCRKEDNIKCIERLGHKFCYDDRNLDLYTKGLEIKDF
ncbi:MAG: hypothetical protein WC966_02605 [Bradymonadales bacterium]